MVSWLPSFVNEQYVDNFIFKWDRTNFLPSSVAIVSKKLNAFNNCNLTLIILFTDDYLFAYSEVVRSIGI